MININTLVVVKEKGSDQPSGQPEFFFGVGYIADKNIFVLIFVYRPFLCFCFRD